MPYSSDQDNKLRPLLFISLAAAELISSIFSYVASATPPLSPESLVIVIIRVHGLTFELNDDIGYNQLVVYLELASGLLLPAATANMPT